jgi:hypothetical protein
MAGADVEQTSRMGGQGASAKTAAARHVNEDLFGQTAL